MCVELHSVQIFMGSLSRSIWRNSPHLKMFSLTPRIMWLTNIRYVDSVSFSWCNQTLDGMFYTLYMDFTHSVWYYTKHYALLTQIYLCQKSFLLGVKYFNHTGGTPSKSSRRLVVRIKQLEGSTIKCMITTKCENNQSRCYSNSFLFYDLFRYRLRKKNEYW